VISRLRGSMHAQQLSKRHRETARETGRQTDKYRAVHRRRSGLHFNPSHLAISRQLDDRENQASAVDLYTNISVLLPNG